VTGEFAKEFRRRAAAALTTREGEPVAAETVRFELGAAGGEESNRGLEYWITMEGHTESGSRAVVYFEGFDGADQLLDMLDKAL
jgi:hypothetical protein